MISGGVVLVRYLGWLLLAIYLLLGIVGLTLQTATGTVPYGNGPATFGWLNFLSFGVWSLVGALLLARQPRNPVGFCYALIPLCTVLVEFSYGVVQAGPSPYLGSLPVTKAANFWLASSGFLAAAYMFTVLFVLFPTGKPFSPGWRVFLWVSGIALMIYAITGVLAPDHLLNPASAYWVETPPFDVNPFGLSENVLNAIGTIRWVSYGIVILSFFTAVVQLFIRLRRAQGVERQQLKWIVFAASFVIPGLSLLILGITITAQDPWPSVIQRLGSIILSSGIAGIGVASAIAILRYRLFDIDIIIRRTTVYVVLSAVLAIAYFAAVILLQRLLSPITGESTVAVVLSTLLIAALFLPLRRWVQEAIDRRFYRQKYDAEKVLSRFAATVRDETDLDALTDELVRVIKETMQPEHVSVWLKPIERPHETKRLSAARND